MADQAIVFALANPDPEVDPFAASKHAAIVATGRSDYPNQINNVLAFPGFFRGMLDSGAHEITDECLLAAATAIADCVAARRTQRQLHRALGVRPRRRVSGGRRGPQSHHLTTGPPAPRSSVRGAGRWRPRTPRPPRG